MSDEPDTVRTCTAGQLRGAVRLSHRYFTARQERGEVIEGDTARELNRTAGLDDDWTDEAERIAARQAHGNLHALGACGTHIVMIETALLERLIAAAYVHGMSLGAMAALDVVDPDTEADA